MDKEKMIATLEQELYQKTTGDKSAIEITPGGQQNGLDYGPSLIELVVLDNDGKTVAYRYSDDAYDADWQLGSIEDAVDATVEALDMFG